MLAKEQTFKNYKELANFMGWKEIRGNYMKARLKELETLCKYHKEGNKFIIDEVYEVKLEKVDNRGTNSIYANDIEKLIIDMCSVLETDEEGLRKIELTTNNLLLALNIINNNYTVGSKNQKRLSQYLEIPIETIKDFYDSTYNKNKKLIESGLNKMQNKCLIKWFNVLNVCTKEYVNREATNEEIEMITEIEQRVLRKLEKQSKSDVFISGKWNVFNNEVNRLLAKETDLIYSYRVYKIITTKSFRKAILEQREKNEIKYNLNNNIIDSAIKSANKRHDKALAKKENTLGKLKEDKYNNRATDKYVIDTKQLTDLVLSINTDVKLANIINMYLDEAYTYETDALCESENIDKELANFILS